MNGHLAKSRGCARSVVAEPCVGPLALRFLLACTWAFTTPASKLAGVPGFGPGWYVVAPSALLRGGLSWLERQATAEADCL